MHLNSKLIFLKYVSIWIMLIDSMKYSKKQTSLTATDRITAICDSSTHAYYIGVMHYYNYTERYNLCIRDLSTEGIEGAVVAVKPSLLLSRRVSWVQLADR